MDMMEIAGINLPPLVILDEGEYRLSVDKVIDNFGEKAFKSGREGWTVILKAQDHPTAEDLFLILWQSTEEDPEKTQRMSIEQIQNFAAAFGITGDDSTGWVGLEAWAKVSVEKDDQGKDRNTVKSFTVKK